MLRHEAPTNAPGPLEEGHVQRNVASNLHGTLQHAVSNVRKAEKESINMELVATSYGSIPQPRRVVQSTIIEIVFRTGTTRYPYDAAHVSKSQWICRTARSVDVSSTHVTTVAISLTKKVNTDLYA